MFLGIYGAGGSGREILDLAYEINKKKVKWKEIFFVVDNKSMDFVQDTKVLNFEELSNLKSTEFELIIAVGEPSTRNLLKQKIKEKGYNLATLIHPLAYVGTNTIIGKGTIIQYSSFVSCNVVMGENVYVQPNAGIGHDNIIKDDAVISSLCQLAGHCTIGTGTYLGMNVCVKENITIGDYSIIGMGSMVIRDIPDEVIAIGTPARPMKKNEDRRVFK